LASITFGNKPFGFFGHSPKHTEKTTNKMVAIRRGIMGEAESRSVTVCSGNQASNPRSTRKTRPHDKFTGEQTTGKTTPQVVFEQKRKKEG